MTATRVTWRQAFWAVVGATVLGAFATLPPLLALTVIGLPLPTAEDASGQGWPWRIGGPWSLAADIGPLVLVGGAFAWFAERFTSTHTRAPTRRLPIAATAALLGWMTVNRPTNPGLIGASGLATFLALMVVTREMSGRERRPWRWTPRSAWAALVLACTLALASLSYGFLHPLSAGVADSSGRDRFEVTLRNDGRADVRLLSVTVPLLRTRALVGPADSYEYSPDDPDAGMVPISGKTITGGDWEQIAVVRAAGCSTPRTVDRLNVRLRVLGRTVDQMVRIDPVALGCA
jgi:hypothetical protein